MRVLTAVDLSFAGHDWLMARAAALADRMQATVDALYVHPPGTPSAAVEDQVQRLAALLAELPPEHRGRARSEPGDVVEAIVAASGDYDGLVVGPREPGALEALLRGPMATRVLRGARCPVLVPRGEGWPDGPLRMLVGVDTHGGMEQRVLALASQWAGRLGARLDAVYALGDRPPVIKDKGVRERAHREWLAAREPERQAVAALLQAVPEAHRGEAIVRAGDADEVLCELSKTHDLVVVGNRERQGLSRLLLGAVATTVVRQSACDVLVLPTAEPV